jgi:hypothetical protein
MIWSIVLAIVAYSIIASAGYESARQGFDRDARSVSVLLHVFGVVALSASIYLAANSN